MKGKDASPIAVAFHLNAAPVELHDFLRYGQPETDTSLVKRAPSLPDVKSLEQPGDVLGWDALSRIGDREPYVSII